MAPTVAGVYDLPSGEVAVVVDNHDGAGWCLYYWGSRTDYALDMAWNADGPVGGDLVTVSIAGLGSAEEARIEALGA